MYRAIKAKDYGELDPQFDNMQQQLAMKVIEDIWEFEDHIKQLPDSEVDTDDEKMRRYLKSVITGITDIYPL